MALRELGRHGRFGTDGQTVVPFIQCVANGYRGQMLGKRRVGGAIGSAMMRAAERKRQKKLAKKRAKEQSRSRRDLPHDD